MSNPEFELAEQFALHTRKHCFVTGRAGTGKTTLLRKLVQSAQKNIVVVAPTGIAAVNAGGITLHSMFGLPLTCGNLYQSTVKGLMRTESEGN
jgi:ABC-type phosphate/phosphonate transport system ATPase subunit